MKKFLFVFVAAFAVMAAAPSVASAQPIATQNNAVGWDQVAPDLTTASNYTYRHYDDGSTIGVVLAGVVCTAPAGPDGFPCKAPFPAFTPANHTIAISAAEGAVESLPSTPLAFQFAVVPAIPSNVRVTTIP